MNTVFKKKKMSNTASEVLEERNLESDDEFSNSGDGSQDDYGDARSNLDEFSDSDDSSQNEFGDSFSSLDGYSDYSHESDEDEHDAANKVKHQSKGQISPGWQEISDDYTPVHIPFKEETGISEESGLTIRSEPFEYFKCFLTDGVLNLFVVETNRCAQQCDPKLKRGNEEWHDVDIVEIKKFIGVLLYMGISQEVLFDYGWMKNNALKNPCTESIMTPKRFRQILKFWNFSNSENAVETNAVETNALHKIREVTNSLTSGFSRIYKAGQHLSIDEPVCCWRDDPAFTEYNRDRRPRYDAKLYFLRESGGYVLKTLVKCRNRNRQAGLGFSESVVLDLMQGFLKKGHHLYISGSYTSPSLVRKLCDNGTHVCGSFRSKKKGLPEATNLNLTRRQVVCRRDPNLVVLKWHVDQDDMMMSTLHQGKFLPYVEKKRSRKPTTKPDCVIDFKKHMARDKISKEIESYFDVPEPGTIDWYKRVVICLIHVALSNSYHLYKKIGGCKSQTWFRGKVIDSLVTPVVPNRMDLELSRFDGQHFLNLFPTTGGNKYPTENCVYCELQGKTKKTVYFCRTCVSKPALCVVPCTEKYHTDETPVGISSALS